jgi:hypothetical protein
VSRVSTARKVGIVAKVFAQQVGRSRTVSAIMRGVKASAQSLGHVAHQLWLEVTGFTFLAIAGIGAITGFREYEKIQSGQVSGRGRLVLAICFTISFAWFGLSSFWRVRRRTNHQGH